MIAALCFLAGLLLGRYWGITVAAWFVENLEVWDDGHAMQEDCEPDRLAEKIRRLRRRLW